MAPVWLELPDSGTGVDDAIEDGTGVVDAIEDGTAVD